MTFKRTSNGLSNQHLFYKVDAIVFVEGGKGFSINDVIEGTFDINSIDIQFWKRIFSVFHKNETLQFRAVGSKTTLKDIAEDINSGKITNAYVAMDRDFDNIKSRKIQCKCVFYTYGYSWENDVWQIEVLIDVLNSICAADCKNKDVKDEILKIYSAFIKQINSGVCADALLGMDDISFFDRKKHLSYLIFGKKTKPTVNLIKIKTELEVLKYSEAEAIKFGEENDIRTHRDCLGHLISGFCYWLFVYLNNKIKKMPSIARYYFDCIGIEKFISRLSDSHFEEIYNHYKRSFALL
jgi:hypothetical protein